jgi:hypothetical protein
MSMRPETALRMLASSADKQMSESEWSQKHYLSQLTQLFGPNPNVQVLVSNIEGAVTAALVSPCTGLPCPPPRETMLGFKYCPDSGACLYGSDDKCTCTSVGGQCTCVPDSVLSEPWFWALCVAIAALLVALALSGLGAALSAWIALLLAKVAAGLLSLAAALELIKQAMSGKLPGLT